MSTSTYPCSWCDYIFTLIICFGYGSILWWYGLPWWAIVVVVHLQTATWFLETRK